MATGKNKYLNATVDIPDSEMHDMLSSGEGNDTLTAVTDGDRGNQIHIYAGAGNDIINIGPTSWIGGRMKHGAHIFSGTGADKIYLNGLASVPAGTTVAGRLDDFDPASDSLYIDNKKVDLNNPHLLPGYTAQVVLYDGQQYLRVANAAGGQFFYALEGARLLDQAGADRDLEERHFLGWEERDNMAQQNWTVVKYENPMNSVPESLYDTTPTSANKITGADIDDKDGDPELPPETIGGTAANDLIFGNRGDDIISGHGGNDTIDGGFGFDTISSGAGADVINAGKGHDSVRGGTENDLIAGGTDKDTLYGDDGNDAIWGGTENDVLVGGNGNDTLRGGRGNDTLYGGAGTDRLDGGTGNDMVDYRHATSGVVVSLTYQATNSGEATGEVLVGVERLVGSNYNDRLYGNAQANQLMGREGNDTLDGLAGNDRLAGSAGSDVFIYRYSHGADVVTDFADNVDTIQIFKAGLDTWAELRPYMSASGTNVVINFGNQQTLTIDNATIAQLPDDIIFG